MKSYTRHNTQRHSSGSKLAPRKLAHKYGKYQKYNYNRQGFVSHILPVTSSIFNLGIENQWMSMRKPYTQKDVTTAINTKKAYNNFSLIQLKP